MLIIFQNDHLNFKIYLKIYFSLRIIFSLALSVLKVKIKVQCIYESKIITIFG